MTADTWTRARAFVFLVVTAGVVLGLRQFWITDLGLDEHITRDGTRRIVAIDRGGAADTAGVRVGDVIEQDPGQVSWRQPFTEREIYRANVRLSQAYAGGTLRLALRRGDTRLSIDVHPRPAPEPAAVLRQVERAGPLYLSFVSFSALAVLLVWRRRPRTSCEVAQPLVACALASIGAGFGLNVPHGSWPIWLFVASSIAINTGVPTGMAVLTWYAWSTPALSSIARSRVCAAFLAILVAVASATSVLDGFQVIRTPLPGNGPAILTDVVLLLAIVAGLFWQRRRAQTRMAGRRVGILLATFAYCTVLGVAVLVFEAWFAGSTVMLACILAACCVIPIGFAASAARYRLFDLDGLGLRVGVQALTVATSIAAFFLISTLVTRLVVDASGTRLAMWLGVAMVVAISGPVRAALQRKVDSFLARDRDAFLSRCADTVAALAACPDASAMLAVVERRLEALDARVLDLSEIDPDEQARLRRAGALHVVELRDSTLVDQLHGLDIELLVHLPHEGATKTEALALALPMSPAALGLYERSSLQGLGRAFASGLWQQSARHDLQRRVATEDDARRQIAMELHDGVGATLAAARVFAQLARQETEVPATGEALHALERTLSEGLTDLRLTLASLDDRRSDWSTLHARIRRHVSDLCNAAGLEVKVTVDGSWPDEAPPATRLATMRVIQEAVTNVIRHAGARAIRCELSGSPTCIRLVVEDDGRGLPDSQVETAHAGHGLRNMTRRARDLGGDVVFERPESGGTRVVATLRVQNAEQVTYSCDPVPQRDMTVS